MPAAPPVAVDVLVLGGGPAGAAAALTLDLHTRWRVALLEGTRYEHPRVGENVSAALHPQLAYLGAECLVAGAECALPAHVTRTAWGSARVDVRDAIFTGHGSGLLIDRRRFDQGLVDLLAARGGSVVQGAWLRRVERRDGCWSVTFEQDGAERTVTAAQVIDATGRRAAFARRVGAEVSALDRLVAVVRHVPRRAGAHAVPGVLVESVEDGWWYSATLPGDQAVFAFMTDADLLARARIATPDAFDARLRHAPATHERAGACARESPCSVHPAATQGLMPACGDGWVAAGDALLALDPLSSIGIGHAIDSGIQSARLVDHRLRGGTGFDAAYARDTAAHLHAFLAQRDAIYGQEQRWPDAPFWRRRHAVRPASRDAQAQPASA